MNLLRIQLEIDLTIEFEGTIGVFEAKNGKPDNFNIYQIYHPFLHYHNISQKPDMKNKIKKIVSVYVVRDSSERFDNIKLWAYTFSRPQDMSSIKFIKSASYKLINK